MTLLPEYKNKSWKVQKLEKVKENSQQLKSSFHHIFI